MPFKKKKPGKGRKGQQEKLKNQNGGIIPDDVSIEKQEDQDDLTMEVRIELEENVENMEVSPSNCANIAVKPITGSDNECKHEGKIIQEAIKSEELSSFQDNHHLLNDSSVEHQKKEGQIQLFQKEYSDQAAEIIEINSEDSNGTSQIPLNSPCNEVQFSQILSNNTAVPLQSLPQIASSQVSIISSVAAEAAPKTLPSKAQNRVTRSSVNNPCNDLNITNTYEMLSYSRQGTKRKPNPTGLNGENTKTHQEKATILASNESLKTPNCIKIFEGATWTNRTGQKKKAGVYPAKRWGHTSVMFEKYMYVYGGCGKQADTVKTSSVFRLDCESFEWEQLSVPENSVQPQARDSHTASVVGTSMWVFGGSNYETLLNEFWRFDLISHLWVDETHQIHGQIPSPREGHSVAVLHERFVVIIGGFNSMKDTILTDIFLLDTIERKCQKIGEMTGAPRESASASVIGESIYLFGGQGSKEDDYFNDLFHIHINDVYSSNPSVMMNRIKISEESNEVEQKQQPRKRSSHQQISFQNRFLIVIGGETSIKQQENDQINSVQEQNCQRKEDCSDAPLISTDNGNHNSHTNQECNGSQKVNHNDHQKLIDENFSKDNKTQVSSLVASADKSQGSFSILVQNSLNKEIATIPPSSDENSTSFLKKVDLQTRNESSALNHITEIEEEPNETKSINEIEVDPLADVWVFDTRECLWREIHAKTHKNGFKGRFNFSASLLKDKVITFGGTQSQEHLLEDIMVLSLREETIAVAEKNHQQHTLGNYIFLPENNKQEYFLEGQMLTNETLVELRKNDLREQLKTNASIESFEEFRSKCRNREQEDQESPFKVILGIVDGLFQLSSDVYVQFQGNKDLTIQIKGIGLSQHQFQEFIGQIDKLSKAQRLSSELHYQEKGDKKGMKCNFNEPIEEEKQEEEEDVEYNEDNSSILRNKLQNLARVLEIGAITRLGEKLQVISQAGRTLHKAVIEYQTQENNNVSNENQNKIENNKYGSLCAIFQEEVKESSEYIRLIVEMKRAGTPVMFFDEDNNDIVLTDKNDIEQQSQFCTQNLNMENCSNQETILPTILHNSIDYSFTKYARYYYYQPVQSDKLYLNDQLVEFKSYNQELQENQSLKKMDSYCQSLSQSFSKCSFFTGEQNFTNLSTADQFQNGCLVYFQNRLISRYKVDCKFGQAGVKNIVLSITQGKIPYVIHGTLVRREKYPQTDNNLNNKEVKKNFA